MRFGELRRLVESKTFQKPLEVRLYMLLVTKLEKTGSCQVTLRGLRDELSTSYRNRVEKPSSSTVHKALTSLVGQEYFTKGAIQRCDHLSTGKHEVITLSYARSPQRGAIKGRDQNSPGKTTKSSAGYNGSGKGGQINRCDQSYVTSEPILELFGEGKFVEMTREDYEKLATKYSQRVLDSGIQILDDWISQKPGQLSWFRKKYTSAFNVLNPKSSWVWDKVRVRRDVGIPKHTQHNLNLLKEIQEEEDDKRRNS